MTWAADSVFNFFPIERDPLLGWAAPPFRPGHDKPPALCARSKTRDYVDIVELHKVFPLPVIVWAACRKDPGWNPHSLLTMMRRFARLDPAKLAEIQALKLDPVVLKTAWVEMSIYA